MLGRIGVSLIQMINNSFIARKYTCGHVVFALFLLMALLFLKKMFIFQLPQLWAEDAVIFFLQAHDHGFLSLFEPYNAYYHFIPRLIAYLGSYVNYYDIPAYYLFSTVLVTLMVGYFIFTIRLNVTVLQRYLLVVSLALVPSNGETLLNITNLQWVLSLLFIVFYLENTPDEIFSKLIRLIMVAFISLTTLFSIIFYPLYIFKVIKTKDNYSKLILVVLTIGALLQLHTYFVSSRGSSDAISYFFAWLDISFVTYSKYIYFHNSDSILPTILFLGVLLILITASRGRNLNLYLLYGYIFIILIIEIFSYSGKPVLIADRYLYIPLFLSAAVLIFLMGNKAAVALGAGLLYFLLVLSSLSHYKSSLFIDYGWGKAVGRYYQQGKADITVNPGWSFRLQ